MGRRNKPWYRPDIGWWVTNVGRKQFRLAKGKGNKAEADRAFHELMALRPRRPEAWNARTCDLVEAFLRFASHQGYANDTQRNYAFYLGKFCEHRGYVLAVDLIPDHVTEWIQSKGWNATTAYNAKRAVFRVFSWAVDQGLLTRNPLARMKRENPEITRRCLTREEYCRLLAGARRPFRVFLWSLMETGTRPSELRQLTWDQVRDDRFEIIHHKTAKKTKKPRVIFLTKRMRRRIEQLRARSQSRYVFVNHAGAPWTENAIRLAVNRIKKRQDLPKDVCAYMIRHTFATWALMRGVDPATLAEILGHRGTSTIMRVYLHLAEQKNHMVQAAELAAGRLVSPMRPTAEPR